jgi:RNA polymerase sigma factor (TIGR02999 family)
MNQNAEDITLLLNQLRENEHNQVEAIYPLVYTHLQEVARGQLRHARPGYTFQTTALVHEAYLKMVDQDRANFHNRAHFLAIASIAMRRILISYARKRNADKRGGDQIPVTFHDGMAAYQARSNELLDLDEALTRLETLNPRQSKIVEYRFFGGLTYKEIAKVMGDTEHSVRYDWRVARAWLKREMGEKKSE